MQKACKSMITSNVATFQIDDDRLMQVWSLQSVLKMELFPYLF